MHAQPSSKGRCLIFGQTFRLFPFFMCANSEGYGETMRMCRLSWASAGRLCDKYHNLMSWLNEDWRCISKQNAITIPHKLQTKDNWTAPSEFGTYRLCEQRRFRRACASAQSRQNLRCSLIEAVSQEEPSDRKPDPWPLWMAGHAQLKCVMTECSKTQIRLTGLN